MSRLKRVGETKLFSSLGWLSLVYIFDTLIPFIVLPYSTRMLGKDAYGEFTFGLAVIGYATMLINYGFNLTGVRETAIRSKQGEEAVSDLLSNVLALKLVFMLASTLVIVALIFVIPAFREGQNSILLLTPMLLGNVLNVQWLYQGKQDLKIISLSSVLIRIIYAILVYILIKSPSDLVLYVGVYGASFLVTGILSFGLAVRRYRLHLRKPDYLTMSQLVKNGFHVFVSSAMMTVNSQTAILFLGVFHSFGQTSVYSLANKLASVLTMTFFPIGQALFPHITEKHAISFSKGTKYVIKLSKIILPFYTIATIGLIALRRPLVTLFFGSGYETVISVLGVAALAPLISIASNLIGTQILVASGNNKPYGRAFLVGASLGVVLQAILCYKYAAIGGAIAHVGTELLIVVLMFFAVKGIAREQVIQ